jgi:hypothetical protein
MPTNVSAPRGRPFGWRKPPIAKRPDSTTNVFSVDRWCLEADKSRAWLYSQWAAKKGPRRVRIGVTVTILESPLEYLERVAREQSIDQAPIPPSTQLAAGSST